MFSERAVQLLDYKRERDCQDGGGSTCEVIGTGTVKVTQRDGTVRALEAVQCVSEARYNLISIEVLKNVGSKCNRALSQLAKEIG